MFSETRYALNGDLRVAYRTSREGPRDIVFVPNWITNCELFPEVPSIQGWVEAITSLGRLIFFDQPGSGASDPVITAVLDDMGSSEAVLVAIDGALATAALFAATHPSRTTALVALEGPRRHDNSCGIPPPGPGRTSRLASGRGKPVRYAAAALRQRSSRAQREQVRYIPHLGDSEFIPNTGYSSDIHRLATMGRLLP